jgi:hypothetical protein
MIEPAPSRKTNTAKEKELSEQLVENNRFIDDLNVRQDYANNFNF